MWTHADGKRYCFKNKNNVNEGEIMSSRHKYLQNTLQAGGFVRYSHLFHGFSYFQPREESLVRTQMTLQNLAKEEIKNYYYFKNKRWDLSFSNGKILKLPSKNIEDSIIIYKKLLKNNNLANTKIIDLRVSNQVILTKIDE